MEMLSRIQIAKKLLLNIYYSCADYDDPMVADVLYQFILGLQTDSHSVTETICSGFDIQPEQLTTYKSDMILIVLLDAYQYLNYSKQLGDISDSQAELMKELEMLPFSISNLEKYFKSPENTEKIKTLLLDYCVYMIQPDKFKIATEKYNQENPVDFANKLSHYVQYIEVSDLLCALFEQVAEEFPMEEYPFPQEEELMDDDFIGDSEEEISDCDVEILEGFTDDDMYDMVLEEQEWFKREEERQEKQQLALFFATFELLEEYFQDKYDIDDYIGFLMSYVYAFLIERQSGKIINSQGMVQGDGSLLTLEDETMLSLLNRSNTTFELVTESFWFSKEYVFNSLDLFSEVYYAAQGNVFQRRDFIKEAGYQKKINLLDHFFENRSVEGPITLEGNPIFSTYNTILRDMRKRFNDYPEYIHLLLSDSKVASTLFPQYGLDVKYIGCYQQQMIRYLARKYMEASCFKPVSKMSIEQLLLYEGLMYADATNQNMRNLFEKGYPFYVDAYFQFADKHPTYEKRVFRKLENTEILAKMSIVDPSCYSDATLAKVLLESSFYRYLETRGVKASVVYLENLWKEDKKRCSSYLQEIVVSNYYFFQKNEMRNDFAMAIMGMVEGEKSLESYFPSILSQTKLLTKLLENYLAEENRLEYPISYHDKIKSSPKLKQKIYPSEKRSNG